MSDRDWDDEYLEMEYVPHEPSGWYWIGISASLACLIAAVLCMFTGDWVESIAFDVLGVLILIFSVNVLDRRG